MKQWKYRCELKLLVCQPNPLRPDRVTVGYVLRDMNPDAPRVDVSFAQNLTAVRCIYPDADIEAIRESLRELESMLKNVTDIEQQMRLLPEYFPADFALVAGGGLLTDSIEDELPRLKEQYLTKLRAEKAGAGEGTTATNEVGRPYLRRKMQEAFVQAAVHELLSSEIPVNPYTFEGDVLKIDFGYPAGSKYRMLHAVSVLVGLEQTAMFAMRWPSIRDGFENARAEGCEMMAIVEKSQFTEAEQSKAMQRWLVDAGIGVCPVSELDRVAQEARAILNP